MQITHLGHSAVLLEVADRRLLFDPGNFSDQWHGLTDLDAIFVTHLHPDHVDPEQLPALVARNPQAKIWVEPGVPKTCELPGAQLLGADSTADLGKGLEVAAVGGQHAVIHRDIPMIGNVGLVVRSEGEPTFFHPGDCLAECPQGVDIVGVPAYGPWAAMKEAIDFARAVAAPKGFLIHDGLLNERGWALSFNRINEMTPTELTDLRGAGAYEFS